jgi:NAD+ kinase
MNHVGIVLKDKSEKALDRLHELTDYLDAKSIRYTVIPSRVGDIDAGLKKQIPECDLSVALGGDGTLLFTSRNFSKYNIPIVGINLGGLGFITEFKESELIECMECVLKKEHTFEERMMIDVHVNRNNKQCWIETGLNDLVINTGGISRLLLLEVLSGRHLVGRYRSDGIIVATPTGSTAYSLSAGGPILNPNMRAFVICPICPHSLGARPLIVPTEESIKIMILSQNLKINATIDGQVAFNLQYEDELHISRSKTITRLVSLGKRSFYDIVREKLSWKG